MEEAAAVRRAALDAVDDVEPAPLREVIDRRLAEGSMVPGVVTVLAGGTHTDTTTVDGDLTDPVAKRAAGVQLIYDGLRLTRQLAVEEPWGSDVAASANGTEGADATDSTADSADAPAEAPGTAATADAADAADLAIIAADVLVARGFYLLARTEAAADAVEVVRAFGRDQTVRRETNDPSLDRNLEADVLELAVVAGATLTGATPAPRLREYAASLATEPLPAAAAFVENADVEALSTLATDAGPEGVRTVGDQ